jgi:hypothetical protein
MTVRIVVFVVLMMFWLFGGGYYTYGAPNFPVAFGTGTLIPWLCVAILGYELYGGASPPRP